MNRFLKLTFISAVSLILVGFIICFICYSFGGNQLVHDAVEYADDNTPFISLKDHKLNDSINVKVGDIKVGDIKTGTIKVGSNENVTDNKVAKNTEVEKIDISFGAGKLNIYESEDEYVYIQANTNYEFEYGMNGNEFFIESKVEDFLSSGSTHNEISVYLPKGMNIKDIDISCGACECYIEKLYTNKDCNIDIGAGTLVIDSLVADNIDITVGAGSVEINDISVNNADFEVDLGSFDGEGKINKNLDAEVNMGSICLTIDGDKADYIIDADCVMGDIEIDGRSYSKSEKNDNASKAMDLKCSMGDIEINFN